MGYLNHCRKLSLPGNRIGDDGMCTLAKALTMGVDGGATRACAHKLMALPECERVSLSYNEIGEVGIQSLAAALLKGALPSCANGTNIFVAANPGSAAPVRDALVEREHRWRDAELAAGIMLTER